MLLVLPTCRGVYPQTIDPKPIDFSASGSYASCFQIPRLISKRECSMRLGTLVAPMRSLQLSRNGIVNMGLFMWLMLAIVSGIAMVQQIHNDVVPIHGSKESRIQSIHVAEGHNQSE